MDLPHPRTTTSIHFEVDFPPHIEAQLTTPFDFLVFLLGTTERVQPLLALAIDCASNGYTEVFFHHNVLPFPIVIHRTRLGYLDFAHQILQLGALVLELEERVA